jgi:hypothetical protein
MSTYLKSLWLLPAGVFLLSFLLALVLIFSMAAGLTVLYVLASEMFTFMFWLLPLSGFVTVLILLAARIGRVPDTSRQMTRRAIVFAAIAILSPIAFVLLRSIVSGYTR